jgi:hypothetical protein
MMALTATAHRLLAPRNAARHGTGSAQLERATLRDGSLDAGRVNGVFRVHARILYRVHP